MRILKRRIRVMQKEYVQQIEGMPRPIEGFGLQVVLAFGISRKGFLVGAIDIILVYIFFANGVFALLGVMSFMSQHIGPKSN